MRALPPTSVVRGHVFAWGVVILLCAVANVFALTGAIYALQVYDRVLSSRSIETLIALSVLAAGLYIMLAGIEAVRSSILVRIAERVDARLMPTAHREALRLSSHGRPPSESGQLIRDADTVRSYLAGPVPSVLLDLPWVPLYVSVIWLMSAALAQLALAGMLVLIIFGIVADWAGRSREFAATEKANKRNSMAETDLQHAEAIGAMGMRQAASVNFCNAHVDFVRSQVKSAEMNATFGATMRAARLLLQSAIIGAGAYLVITDTLTAGAIIAASIIVGRAVGPVDQVIGSWRAYRAYTSARSRLRAALPTEDLATRSVQVPSHNLVVDRLSVAAPATGRVVLADISFELQAGSALGIVGATASGKSALAHALVGAWLPARGAVRIDGVALDRHSADEIGRHIGYVPQNAGLFPGTIRDNIARLAANADPAAIVDAARLAGVHDAIIALSDGYDTRIDAIGSPLSSGQRQRVALARALYGKPFVVVLDEPDAGLGAEGEATIISVLQAIRERAGIAIVITHRKRILSAVDRVAVVERGRIARIVTSIEGARKPNTAPSLMQRLANT